jgi:23S rRNA (guanine2445-N2)-methyltransferase / 23S rRNA (guanine2069-N7)-methyltransferase
LLAAELDALGARRARVSGAGVAFSGDLRTAYRACLWSRLASRILLHLARVPAGDADVLYAAARELPWESHLTPDGTFAVECTVRGARIAHSHFAALRVKDAVADRFRQRCGRRPDVDLRAPDLRIHLHLRGAEGRVALDLSGEALHRRGYRVESGPAPLRETLAAALLRFSGWPDPERWPALLDPLCGSGTLLAEAALMAADVAPGLLRARFGFEGWRGHDAATWSALLAEARTRRERGLRSLPPMLGGDRDASVLEAARRNLQRCGLDAQVTLQQRGLDAWLDAPPPAPRGLLVSNPPYGGRLESGAAREALAGLAALARGPLSTWDMALLLPQDSAWPEKGVGTVLAVPNGPLRCRFQLVPSSTPAARALPAVDADAFANRLRKNERRLGRWRRREGVDCYRVYDADLPDFALAVDVYEGAGGRWAHVQEYAPPPQIDPALALQRRRLALERVARELGVVPGRVVFKTRERQRGRDQYHRRGDGDASLLEVREGEARLLVNLHDYLDTGLFLDHRPLRRWLRANAAGKRFANLFAYTGAATVAAGLGGATDTVSVDLSRVYLAWAARNLSLNGLHPPRHATVHADCRAWLDDAARRQPPFDLILVDPPTFSNSKRMRGTFDVQRDHVPLLRAALARLAPGGTLIFSCNRRGFRLDSDALGPVTVRDWTRWSLPPDFARPPPAHHCFALQPA